MHGFANSHWPTKTSNVEWVGPVSVQARDQQTTEWRLQNERAEKMIPNTDTSEPIFFKILDPEGTNDITRSQKLQIALYYDFTYSRYYPTILGDAHSSEQLLKIQNAHGKPKGTKKSKSSKSKANQSKSKGHKTEETQGKDTETAESAKSLEVKKYIEAINESLRQRVQGDAFSKWCETLIIHKTTESKLEDCQGFFSSSYSSGQSLDSILAQMQGLSRGQMADAALTAIESNPALHRVYVDWTKNREVGQATRELWVLKEAVLLLKGPLGEFRHEQEEIEMQKTRERQRRFEEQKERQQKNQVRNIGRTVDTLLPELPNEMTDNQKTEWCGLASFADSTFFPKTDEATIYKSGLSDLSSMPSNESADDVNKKMWFLRDTISTDPVLRDAHQKWLADKRNRSIIDTLRSFSESQPFKDLPKERATGLTSRLQMFKSDMSYEDTRRIIGDIERFILADGTIPTAVSSWRLAHI